MGHPLAYYWLIFLSHLEQVIMSPELTHTFLFFVKNLYPNIKFTFETEINSIIHYLDLPLTNTHNKITFSVFRIPTLTNVTIILHPPVYNHLNQRHINQFYIEHYRYRKLCQQMDVIKSIALNNNFHHKFINKLIFKKKDKQFKSLYTHTLKIVMINLVMLTLPVLV